MSAYDEKEFRKLCNIPQETEILKKLNERMIKYHQRRLLLKEKKEFVMKNKERLDYYFEGILK
jgi:hypothetical protein